ncbi:ABC-2 transporter permease [Eubacterium sp.]|uniref:ABC-2 transporter permease n=1 Tax=Eubacterium sp. TaxID=142586 RepID=UPI0026E05BE6|nr:ABC-2 transporter permease [Eubacterium sp.]MDO5434100.1 ABC-2 transporter permease [Eubacterium sp.]
MKGLLLKDRHLITKNGIGALAFTIVFVAFMMGGLGIKNQFWLPLVSMVFLVNGDLFYDRNSGWEKSSVVMPVSRKNIVQSKYLLFALAGLLGLLYGIVLTLAVCAVFSYALSAREMVGNILSGTALMLCAGAVDLPICLLSMKQAGKKLLFALVFAAVTAVLWLLLMVPRWLNGIDPLVCFAVLSVFAGGACFASYAIVCRHYEKMDL